MAQAVRITEAQMTALVTAGIFEEPEDDHAVLAAAIRGDRLVLTDNGSEIARAVCDLSNDADDLARTLSGEQATWARKDSRVLASLYSTVLRQIH